MHRIEVEAEVDLLAENKRLAEENRRFFRENGILAVNIMGAIGSGKTLLIEKTIEKMKDLKVGAVLGDVVCKADYERVKRLGVKAEAISTGKECHLDAHLVSHKVGSFKDVDVLLIENVGNLICPVDFDLGEDLRVVMVSVTEGDDVIEKHPKIFTIADVVIINKVKLAKLVGANLEKMKEDVRRLNPRAKLILMDLKEGVGLDEWIEYLREEYVSRNSG